MNTKSLLPALFVTTLSLAVPTLGHAEGATSAADGSRTVATTAKDATITASVKSKLLADAEIAGMKIDVDTFDKVVTLSGTVTSDAQKERAATLAKQADGVSSVKNELIVATK